MSGKENTKGHLGIWSVLLMQWQNITKQENISHMQKQIYTRSIFFLSLDGKCHPGLIFERSSIVFYKMHQHTIVCLGFSSSVLEFHDSLPPVLIHCFILSYAKIPNWGSFMFNYLLYEEIPIMLNRIESFGFDLLKKFNEM